MFIRRILPLVVVLALPCTSWAAFTEYTSFAAYDAALGGNHTMFLDFETDSGGNDITPTGSIGGGVFSTEVTYSSPDYPSSLVNIADIGGSVDNEIGPYDSWNGTLAADYGAYYFATFMTIIDGSPDTVIRFYDGATLLGTTTHNFGGTFETLGLITDTPFNRLEIDGTFHAIDAHYVTVIPAPGAGLLGLIGLSVVAWARRR